MVGGDYYTWFDNGDIESRKVLYFLESLGISKMLQTKGENQGQYKYKWELTDKGKEFIEKNITLKKLWEDGRVVEFYKMLIELEKIKNDFK